METKETDLEQEKQLDLKARVRNLRERGRTYRQIAEAERISISQISRILNDPDQQSNKMMNREGDIAAKVFQLLEKGTTLPLVVIELRLEPEIVENLHKKWAKLKQMDLNHPNLEKIDEKLNSHIWAHHDLDILLSHAMEMSTNRRNFCNHKKSDESCKFSPNMDEEKISPLSCIFCNYFVSKEELVIIPP